jgi:hypothetical protein
MEKSIEDWCEDFNIYRYEIGEDGSVDTNNSIYLAYHFLDKIPIKFGIAGDFFYCNHNNLTTLIGSPKIVRGTFNCSSNKLSTLQYSPNLCGGSYVCDRNSLITLNGCTKEIMENFFCYNNRLVSLDGGPITVRGKYDCTDNNLISLEGYPKLLFGEFYCKNNPVYVEYHKYENFNHYIRFIKLKELLTIK